MGIFASKTFNRATWFGISVILLFGTAFSRSLVLICLAVILFVYEGVLLWRHLGSHEPE